MTQDDRSNLATLQENALRAVLSGGHLPSGMNAAQVEQAKASLLSKRRREAALSAPHLAEALGDSFREKFDDYARHAAYPARGGPIADAEGFGRYLRRQGLLPAVAELEHMILTATTRRRLQLRIINRSLLASVRFRGRVRVYRLL